MKKHPQKKEQAFSGTQKNMKFDRITLRKIDIPFKTRLITSHFTLESSSAIIVKVKADGMSGWGESALLPGPWYNEEARDTAWIIQRDIVKNPFKLNLDSTLTVPNAPDSGVDVDEDFLDDVTVEKNVIRG